MPAYLEKADAELIAVAADVIDRWHPRLRDARIGLLYRSEAKKHGTGRVLASISLVPSTIRAVAGFDYVMWVAKDRWEKLDPEQRRALIDHEFCHAQRGEKWEWTIVGHDIEEFICIIERHGLWKNDLRSLGTAVNAAQMRLPHTAESTVGALVAIEPTNAVLVATVEAA